MTTASSEVLPDAYVLLTAPSGKRSTSGDRRTVAGAAGVRVLDAVDGTVRVQIVACSSASLMGTTMRCEAKDVYASTDERDYFGRLARFLWGDATPPGPRPRVSLDPEQGPSS